MKSFLTPFESGIDYKDGIQLFYNLESFGACWLVTSSSTEKNHNMNCDIIDSVNYTDVNGVFPETVSWVSYWNEVDGDEPIEVMPEKAHWEILE